MKKATLTLLMLVAFSYLSCANKEDMPKLKDLTGKVYGRLTVISHSHFTGFNKTKRHHWICTCSCGVTKSFMACSLTGGYAKSCGCLKKEETLKRLITHGEGGKATITKEYITWVSIKARCTRKTDKTYRWYGARGIVMCERWINSYETFLADMGRAPSQKHSIERNNNNGNYEPSNCRWATQKEQANNRRGNRIIEYNGIRKNLTQWCESLGLEYKKIHQRIHKGNWSIDDAFTKL
jgi:hypothetical protein